MTDTELQTTITEGHAFALGLASAEESGVEELCAGVAVLGHEKKGAYLSIVTAVMLKLSDEARGKLFGRYAYLYKALNPRTLFEPDAPIPTYPLSEDLLVSVGEEVDLYLQICGTILFSYSQHPEMVPDEYSSWLTHVDMKTVQAIESMQNQAPLV